MNPSPTADAIRHVVLGNPENRRVAMFQHALLRHGLPAARVVSYQQVLSGAIPCHALFEHTDILRIESPGENTEVEKRLIARGAQRAAQEDCEQIDPCVRWHWKRTAGDCVSCANGIWDSVICWTRCTAVTSPIHRCNCTTRRTTFRSCSTNANVRRSWLGVASLFPPHFRTCRSFEDLMDQIRRRGWNRVFIKLAHGSSASGVVALHVAKHRLRAVTPIELVYVQSQRRLYNNLKVRTYVRLEEIRAIVDYVCRESAHVEQWMPKAALGRKTFDLRIVVIGHQAQHAVVRTAAGILTNLHLGNRRGDLSALVRQMGAERWNQVTAMASEAFAPFRASTYAGMDLLLTPGCRQTYVLEVNAFGDLLPGLTYAGDDTYGAEVHYQLGLGRRQTKPK